MDAPGEMFRRFQFAFDECLADDHFYRDIGQLTSLPGFHLLTHRLEVALHSIHSDRNAIDQRERLRVFGEHRGERTWDNVTKSRNSVCRGVQRRGVIRMEGSPLKVTAWSEPD